MSFAATARKAMGVAAWLPCLCAFAGAQEYHLTLLRDEAYSISNSRVRQGGDKRATKIVQVVQPGASAEANTVSLMN